jgi:Domain of unknown function (DUF4203)
MLPHSYELPAAVLIVLTGALSCFAGYRLFKLVLGIYGFLIGAAFASSMVAPSNTIGMIVAAIVGGVAGSVILVFAYFVGVALLGAALGWLVIHVVWTQVSVGEPPWIAVAILAAIGAIGAMFVQRYVIIVSTAFAGAWTILVGGLAAAADRGAARAGDVWILYPFTPAPGARWVPLAWVALGAIGTVVQLSATGGKR